MGSVRNNYPIRFVLVEVEVSCSTCYGGKTRQHEGYSMLCFECNGVGHRIVQERLDFTTFMHQVRDKLQVMQAMADILSIGESQRYNEEHGINPEED